MPYIKIDKRSFSYNLDVISRLARGKDRVAGVIKDNAYGHGIEIVAKLLNGYGVKESVVISLEEALKIKRYFKNTLILNDFPIRDAQLSFSVPDINLLNIVERGAKIELKVDTGMHRNGITIDELPQALDIIKRRGLNLFGVFTHFKSADEFDTTLAWQKKSFEEVKRLVTQKGFKVRFHSHNSSALLRSKSFDEDIARVGIAMYGFNEVDKRYKTPSLKPILSLYAKRVSTRRLLKGQKVGYGGEFTAPKDMVVSTYDIGYGDGLFRGDAKNPLVVDRGLPILGRVSMDFITVESTKDEILVFNNAQMVANHLNTISYEIITALKPSIQRVLV